jgi:ABC-type branched-subunit amino acid transport system substrate-binding protein
MKQLVERDRVLAIIGNVGTPTAVVAIPIAQQSGIAFFGAFTGAGVLRRNPPDRCVINYRASYAEETAAMVGALIEHAGIKPDEIAFFTQRDAYGDSGFNGGITALKSKVLKSEYSVPHGRYDRNTEAVEDAVAEILAAPTLPKAIIMVGTAPPSAKFVRLVRAAGIDALMLSVSFVGSSQLAAQLGKDAEGVIVGGVVPPQTADLPIIREFRAVVTGESMQSREVVLEGYIVGRIMCRALATIDGEPTRDRIIAALEGLGRFDLGLGAPLNLSNTCHQACSRVWATRLHNGSVQSIEWSALKPGTRSAAAPEEQR